jgi:hypothetical protein
MPKRESSPYKKLTLSWYFLIPISSSSLIVVVALKSIKEGHDYSFLTILIGLSTEELSLIN